MALIARGSGSNEIHSKGVSENSVIAILIPVQTIENIHWQLTLTGLTPLVHSKYFSGKIL